MPEHKVSTSTLRGKIRARVTLRQGEALSLCRCWQSKNFPLCDSSHKKSEDDKGPVVVHTDCNQPFHAKKKD